MQGDIWGWAEVGGVNEPGLLANRNRQSEIGDDASRFTITTFHTEAADATLAFDSSVISMTVQLAALRSGLSADNGSLGNWSNDKNYIVYIYSNNVNVTPDDYLGKVDTSFRPVPSYPTDLSTVFTDDAMFFPITANSLYRAALPRSVPPGGQEISFLSDPNNTGPARSQITIISAGNSPAIVDTIAPTDLTPAGLNISYYAWSPDGKYLVAQVDDRLVVYNRNSTSVELDIVESTTQFQYQFSEDGSMLFYVKGGLLYIRTAVDNWAVSQIVSEDSDTFTCADGVIPFIWDLPRLSPDMTTWVNVFNAVCGGAFDADYYSYLRFKDDSFFPLASDNVSAFASGVFMGDFSNDTRWYRGGDGNINGESVVTAGPGPDWTQFDQGGTFTEEFQMRSFQPF